MSEQPFDAEWCGDDKYERTPLALRKSFISPGTNCEPLSVTTSSGYPYIANKPRGAVIVETALVEDIGTIAILDFASTLSETLPYSSTTQ